MNSIYIGKRKGLYILANQEMEEEREMTRANSTKAVSAELWHRRLGYPSILRYNLIRRTELSIPI